MELPEQVLVKALQQAAGEEKTLLLKSLSTRPAIQPSVIDLVSSWLKDNASQELKTVTLGILERPYKALSEEAVNAIAERLEDGDRVVRKAAVNTLNAQSTLSEGMLKAIAARLRDKKSDVREAAFNTLKAQSTLSQEILEAIAARLKDTNSNIRRAKVDMFICQLVPSSIPDQCVKALFKALLQSSFHEHISWHAMEEMSYVTRGLEEDCLEGWQARFADMIQQKQEDMGIPFPHAASCNSLLRQH